MCVLTFMMKLLSITWYIIWSGCIYFGFVNVFVVMLALWNSNVCTIWSARIVFGFVNILILLLKLWIYFILCIQYCSTIMITIQMHARHHMYQVLIRNDNINHNMLMSTQSIHARHIMYPVLVHNWNINTNICAPYHVSCIAIQLENQYKYVKKFNINTCDP